MKQASLVSQKPLLTKGFLKEISPCNAMASTKKIEYCISSVFFVEAIACKIMAFPYMEKNGALRRLYTQLLGDDEDEDEDATENDENDKFDLLADKEIPLIVEQ